MDEQHVTGPGTFAEAIVAMQAQQAARSGWKWQLTTFFRQLAVAVVTSAIIVGGLIFGFAGQTASQVQRDLDTLHANLAQACVLSLPVTDNGRNEKDVARCFTQYGLQAPSIPGG